jgi:hypothetical protein
MSSVASTPVNKEVNDNEVNSMKQSIDMNLPSNNSELVWAINFIGKNLFKNWDSINSLYKNKKETESKYISSMVIVINDCFKNEKDKNELINYLLTSLVNKYSDTFD